MSEEHAARRRRLEALHQQGRAVARRLAGRPRSEAVDEVVAAGLRPEVVTPDVTALTMELRYDRVRIFVDDEGVVTRAEAG